MNINAIKVIIVDDHQILIDSLKTLLETVSEIEVIGEANNGKEAIDLLNKIKADVVLMDIDMPILNGLETTKIISKLFTNTKVLALTSLSEKAVVNEMIALGASGYILKNITKEILVNAIIAVSKGEKYFSSEISLSLMTSSEMKILKKNNNTNIAKLLTKREIEVLKLIAAGLSNKEISKKIFISEKTVKAHRENIMSKLDIHNVVGLVRFAIEYNIV